MAIYKRYNTRKKRIPWGIIAWIIAILLIFSATAIFGHYLGEKAKEKELLYTGTDSTGNANSALAPLSQHSLHGEYVEPEDLAEFVSESDDVWASIWIYKDGKATFATEFDIRHGIITEELPSLDSFDIEARTIGLFEVGGIYADDADKAVITEYEMRLLDEFAACGLDEVVLVFNSVNADNYDEIFEYVSGVKCAKVVCVPYSTLDDEVFFSKASEKQITLALNAEGVSVEQFEADIEEHGFYFTKHNLRVVLSGSDTPLVDVLKNNVLSNYQFLSPTVSEENKK